MIQFGAGKLIAVPKFDKFGLALTTPTPVVVAVLQEVSVDISFETKTLHGEKKFAVAAAQGKGKVGWKAKTGNFKGAVLGSLLLGQKPSAVRHGVVPDQVIVVPEQAPYTVTVDPPADGEFVADLGLVNASTGQPLARVAAVPVAGQYVVTQAGQYTFAAADAKAGLLCSYEYKADDASAELYEITNDTMGYMPMFSAVFYNRYMGKTQVLKLNSNVLSKLALPYKSDDFTVSDMDAEAFADEADKVGYFCHY